MTTIKKIICTILQHLFFFNLIISWVFISTTFLLVCFVCLEESTFEKRKTFLFHFESSFCSWDNHILTFQIFTCHDVIKYLMMKHKAYFTEQLGKQTQSGVWYLASICNITKETFLLKKSKEHVAWKLVPGPF